MYVLIALTNTTNEQLFDMKERVKKYIFHLFSKQILETFLSITI